MIGTYIYKTLKTAIPALSDGAGEFHIYPISINEGIDLTNVSKAVTYTNLSSTIVFDQVGARVQITCIGETYGHSEELSYQVASAFANKRYSTGGDPISTAVEGRTDLGKDVESGKYLSSVTIHIKTAQLIG